MKMNLRLKNKDEFDFTVNYFNNHGVSYKDDSDDIWYTIRAESKTKKFFPVLVKLSDMLSANQSMPAMDLFGKNTVNNQLSNRVEIQIICNTVLKAGELADSIHSAFVQNIHYINSNIVVGLEGSVVTILIGEESGYTARVITI